ncbi:MAG: PilN domain-containing protein [Candidatus Aminicenantes bacterium]|nr:PilN domain-containing protein [Candidatus Aminicenantes bacterium]
MIRVNLLKAEKKDVEDRSPVGEDADGGKVTKAGRRKLGKHKPGQDKSGEPKKKTPIGNLIVFLALILLGGLAVLQRQSLSRERGLLASAQEEAQRLQPVVDKLDEIEWQKLYLEKKVGLIRDLKAQQGLAVGILDAVSRDIPEWVWLTELVLNKTGVLIKGRALSNVLVSDYVRALEKAGPFGAVGIVNTQQRAEGSNQYLEFTLNATLPAPIPPPAAGAKTPTAAPSVSGAPR